MELQLAAQPVERLLQKRSQLRQRVYTSRAISQRVVRQVEAPLVLVICHKNEIRRLEFWAADRRFESTASLEFQWIKIRCFVEVIDVFDSFEPQGDSKCYWQ